MGSIKEMLLLQSDRPLKIQPKGRERADIQKLAKTDFAAYYEAMKAWDLNLENRFSQEGWRKMTARS